MFDIRTVFWINNVRIKYPRITKKLMMTVLRGLFNSYFRYFQKFLSWTALKVITFRSLRSLKCDTIRQRRKWSKNVYQIKFWLSGFFFNFIMELIYNILWSNIIYEVTTSGSSQFFHSGVAIMPELWWNVARITHNPSKKSLKGVCMSYFYEDLEATKLLRDGYKMYFWSNPQTKIFKIFEFFGG